MNALTIAARWISGRKQLANDLPAAEVRLAEIEGNPPKSADPAEHLAWAEKRDAARREVEALRSALAIATAEAAKAEAAQRAEYDEKRHEDEEKQSKADAALVAKVRTAGEALVAAIEKLAASNARTAEYNAQRGQRSFIPDAETRVRQIPARTIPAEYEDRDQWLDAHGNQPTILRQNSAGELEPVEPIYIRKTIQVCASPERVIPASMPDRYAELLPILKKAMGQ